MLSSFWLLVALVQHDALLENRIGNLLRLQNEPQFPMRAGAKQHTKPQQAGTVGEGPSEPPPPIVELA